jgi:hypothetical protein
MQLKGPMSNSRLYDPTTIISIDGPPSTRLEAVLRWSWRLSLATLAILVTFLAILVATKDIYSPGSDLGYNIGLVGGLLMFSLLAYSLRKRVRALDRLGAMNNWFRYHMFIGIAGPVLILFHSTFRLKSMNGTIAFYAMLVVALSGIIGRFIYRHIHRGLYGRKLTMRTARDDIQAGVSRLVSVFALRGDIEPRLVSFQEYAFAPSNSFLQGLWRFLSLRSKAYALSYAIRAEIRPAMVQQGYKMHLPKRQIILEYKLAKQQLNAYLDAIVKASQLESWERAFSLWHLIHVPFLYLLIISGVVHVVAVHMY